MQNTNLLIVCAERHANQCCFLLHSKYSLSVFHSQTFKPLEIPFICTGKYVSDLVGSPEDSFSYDHSHIFSGSCPFFVAVIIQSFSNLELHWDWGKRLSFYYILSERANATVHYFAYSVCLVHVFTKIISKT